MDKHLVSLGRYAEESLAIRDHFFWRLLVSKIHQKLVTEIKQFIEDGIKNTLCMDTGYRCCYSF